MADKDATITADTQSRMVKPDEIPGWAQYLTWGRSYEQGEHSLYVQFHRTHRAMKREWNKLSANLGLTACGWATIENSDREHGHMVW